jgi:arabinofuranan 3-O-arabinosyltransferase
VKDRSQGAVRAGCVTSAKDVKRRVRLTDRTTVDALTVSAVGLRGTAAQESRPAEAQLDTDGATPSSPQTGAQSLKSRLRRPRWSDLKTAPHLTPRLYVVPVSLMLLGMSLAQQPGKTVIDTKPALALNPSGYLGQQLHLWNAAAEGGSIPNQTVGYLAPMGPYFLLTHALGIPTSIAQRLWMALLLIVAFWGVVRLCDALGIGNKYGRILGGLTYAISPWVLSRIGDLSAFVIGGALLPWILLPLVHFTHGPPERAGSTTARRAAARSAIAVFLIGGTNASVVIDVLIAPTLWLLLMCRGRAAWQLRAWWVAGVGAATLWWLIALLLQARYGIDFLPYTETARVTTSITSLGETIRGTPDWYDYLRFGSIGTASGWTYITEPAAIVGSFAIAGLGLVGLGRGRVPSRRFWLACLAIGVVAIAAAYPEEPKGILSGTYGDLLTGALGPLRNVTKFEPLVRLPLAIGVASCLPLFVSYAARKWRVIKRGLSVGVALVLTAAIAFAAAPLGLIRIYQNNNFAVPAYWKTAADWLAHSATDARTLIIPGTGFAEYSWGNTRDEPLLWLGKTDWAVRDLIPFGSINSTRLLDAIEEQLGQSAAPNLKATMIRAGMGYVLVRNDLTQKSSDPPASSEQIHAALASSGLQRVATFGPMVAGRPSGLDSFLHIKTTSRSYPALEVYKVPGAGKVSVLPASGTAVLSGGPEALATLSGTPELGDRPTVLAADVAAGADGHSQLPADAKPTTWIDTDTLGRRETAYGLVHDATSYLEVAGERNAIDSTAPQIRFDVDPTGHETVASYEGIKSVAASASGFLLRQVSELGPGAAVDGDPNTAWAVSGHPANNVGQWLQVTLPSARVLPGVTVQLRNSGLKIRALRVTTDTGSLTTRLRDTTKAQQLKIPSGSTSRLRLTVTDVAGKDKNLAGVGISELSITGVNIKQSVVLPNDAANMFGPSGPQTVTYAFNRDRGDPDAPLDVDTEKQLSRTFTVIKTADFYGNGTVVGRKNTIKLPSLTAGRLNFSCGTGPDVKIDNKSYQTYVTGSRVALNSGAPVALGLCTGAITLRAGTHTLTTSAGSQPFSIATLMLTNQTQAPVASTRTATIKTWGLEHRSVDMSSGASSVLTIHENFSKSWSATANGKKLTAIAVDGWQQGFVVPAGAATTVTITNHPGILFRQGLLVGAFAVLLLLAAALIPPRRRKRAARLVTLARNHNLVTTRAVSFVLALVTTALVVGPLPAAAVPVLAAIVWWVPRITPVLVAGAFGTVIGVSVSATKHYPAAHRGVFSPVTQIAVALALAAVVLVAGSRGAQAATAPQEPADPVDEHGVTREADEHQEQIADEARNIGVPVGS